MECTRHAPRADCTTPTVPSPIRFTPGWFIAIALLATSAAGNAPIIADEPTPGDRIYLIGNSLTWDTLPGLLGGETRWHVDCGKNLPYIHAHPESPCVKTSVIWPEALKSDQYDVLVIQPHFGSTLDEDFAAIAAWAEMQPQARLVLHTGWNRQRDFERDYHRSPQGDRMTHCPEYFERLIARLKEKFPDREIGSTHAIDVLDAIRHDIERSKAPFQSFSELYRDYIHVTVQVGRYLMHNLMRAALNQPPSSQGFQIDSAQKEYIDRKLAQFRREAEPGSE